MSIRTFGRYQVLGPLGDAKEAIRKYEAHRRARAERDFSGLAAIAYLEAGDRDAARREFDRFEPHAEIDMDNAATAAGYRALVGEPDRAFAMLDRAAALGNDMLSMYESCVFFAPLHADPRWGRFLEGVRGRVAEYRREFHWPPRI